MSLSATKPTQLKEDNRNIRGSNQNSLAFLMLLGVPLSWSVVTGIISTTVFSRNYSMNFVHVFIIVGILGLIFTYKVAIKGMLFLSGGFFIVAFFSVLFALDSPNLLGALGRLLRNTFRYVIGIENHTLAYERLVVWMISITISLFVVIFLYYRFIFTVLFIVLAVTFSILITSPYFSYPLSLYVFILCTLTLLIGRLHQQSCERVKGTSPYARLILPFSFVFIFLVSFLPIPNQGVALGQSMIARPFNYMNETFYNMTSRRDFSIRQVGFGSGVDDRLGGSIVLNHEVFMRVRSDGRLPLYITGATSDTYTGYSWKNTFPADTPIDFNEIEQNLELLERFINHDIIITRWFSHEYVSAEELFREINPFTGEFVFMRSFDIQEVIWNLEVEYYTLEIDVTHFRPSFAFHSGMVNGITTEEEGIYFFRNKEGRIVLNQRFQREASYKVHFHTINHIPFISNLPPWFSYVGYLQGKSDYPEDYWVETIVQAVGGSKWIHVPITLITIRFKDFEITYRDLLDDYLIPRAARITEIYTALPENFPPVIGELAAYVTAGAETNYIKMRLLEQFLSQNFTYTLSPGDPPEDQDFVYHFLFDLQKGYCVYFATAFVTMARSLGLPARYVEGFLVNGVPDQEGYINVLNSMAHAWPEVYFEGYGWHLFEPTPAVGLPQSGEVPATGEWDWDYWMDPDLRGADFEGDRELELEPIGSGEERDGGAILEEEGSVEGFGARRVMGVFFIALTILLLIRGLWGFHLCLMQRREGNKEAVINHFASLLSYLKLLNFEIEDGETIDTFISRVCNKGFLSNRNEKKQLEDAVEIYERARYSQQEISKGERAVVESSLRLLKGRVRSCIGKGRYYAYRLIFSK